MFDIELVRILIVLGVLSVNTFSDLKYRTNYGKDRWYLILGIIGFSLLVFESLDSTEDTLWMILMVVINMTIVLVLWRINLAASGDIIILALIAVTLPVISGGVLLILVIVLVSAVVSAVFGVGYNYALNFITLYHREPLFTKYNESIIKKFITFGLAHKKRSWGKYVISIEKDDGFSITSNPIGKEFSVKNGELVSPGIPLVPFMLFSYVIVLLTF